jgi:hypothetical protein
VFRGNLPSKIGQLYDAEKMWHLKARGEGRQQDSWVHTGHPIVGTSETMTDGELDTLYQEQDRLEHLVPEGVGSN